MPQADDETALDVTLAHLRPLIEGVGSEEREAALSTLVGVAAALKKLASRAPDPPDNPYVVVLRYTLQEGARRVEEAAALLRAGPASEPVAREPYAFAVEWWKAAHDGYPARWMTGLGCIHMEHEAAEKFAVKLTERTRIVPIYRSASPTDSPGSSSVPSSHAKRTQADTGASGQGPTEATNDYQSGYRDGATATAWRAEAKEPGPRAPFRCEHENDGYQCERDTGHAGYHRTTVDDRPRLWDNWCNLANEPGGGASEDTWTDRYGREQTVPPAAPQEETRTVDAAATLKAWAALRLEHPTRGWRQCVDAIREAVRAEIAAATCGLEDSATARHEDAHELDERIAHLEAEIAAARAAREEA